MTITLIDHGGPRDVPFGSWRASGRDRSGLIAAAGALAPSSGP
jgi:hypothetical protein